MLEEIISGERIQQIADMYLGTPGDFMYNPAIFEQIEKHQILDDIDGPFDNPPILFVCPFAKTICREIRALKKSIYFDYTQFGLQFNWIGPCCPKNSGIGHTSLLVGAKSMFHPS